MPPKINEDDLVLFCNTYRTILDIANKFEIKTTYASRLINKMYRKNRVVLIKKNINGTLKNAYISSKYAEKSDIYSEFKYSFLHSDLPAHDPFGLTKGKKDAR